MFDLLPSMSTAVRLIWRDPINLFLAVIPAIMGVGIYFGSAALVYSHSELLVSLFRGSMYTSEHAPLLGKILTVLLIGIVFLLMSWTFVLVVGMIAAPFNSLLSSRIEDRLCGKEVSGDRKLAIHAILSSLASTFANELKKLAFILSLSVIALVLNLVPMFTPVGILILALLASVQFLDYSWSRHDVPFRQCLQELLKNAIPYTLSGLGCLALVSIPLINAVVPAFATSYYTVLWLHRQNRIRSSAT